MQPMLSSWARKTTDKTDDKDSVLIARLTGQLRCYVPEPVDETRGRLRHLGARWEQLLGEHVGCVQQIRDLLECVWPAALERAKQPFKSTTWVAAMSVHHRTRRRRLCPDPTAGPGPVKASGAVEVERRGKIGSCLRILRRLYAALSDPAGVLAHRLGAFERIGWLFEDWDSAKEELVHAEQRMVAVLDELALTDLVCSIKGLSAVGAAAILVETGDLHRFTGARAVVKHAGLAPRERMSGTFTGRARLTGAGRPGLRTAAWRAVWGAQRANPVYAARYRHVTTREENRRKAPQAQTVIAAAILRQLHAVVPTGRAWDPNIAAQGTRVPEVDAA